MIVEKPTPQDPPQADAKPHRLGQKVGPNDLKNYVQTLLTLGKAEVVRAERERRKMNFIEHGLFSLYLREIHRVNEEARKAVELSKQAKILDEAIKGDEDIVDCKGARLP